MDTNDLFKKIEDAMEELPEELRSFLFDGEFDAVFETYKSNFSDQEKFVGLKNKTLEFILGVIPITELKIVIENSTGDAQLVDKLKKDIQGKVIDEILLLLQVHSEMENKTTTEVTSQSNIAPSPSDILARLNQNLTKPTTLAPTKREYVAPSPASSPTIEPTAKPVTDPYREIPQ